MKPRCNSCKFFIEKHDEKLFKIIHNMQILEFDGHCREAIYKQVLNPFFFSLRKRNYTCSLWQWRGKDKCRKQT